MVTVTFYSYKGGTGRTLTLANFARFLAAGGKRVVCIDMDLEAPGLHYKFGVKDRVEGGLVDLLARLTEKVTEEESNHRGLPDPYEYVVAVPVSNGSKGTIHLLPAGRAPSVEYWKQLGNIPWTSLFYSDYTTSVGPLLFMELKARLAARYEPHYILIDSRTGITEISGVATTVLCDHLVCFVLNNRENWEGARAVLRSVRGVPRPPDVRGPVEFTLVMPRIPTDPEEPELIDELTTFFNEPAEWLGSTLSIRDVLVIHSEPGLELDEHLIKGTEAPEPYKRLAREYFQLFSRVAE